MRPTTQVRPLEVTACFCLFVPWANPHWAPAPGTGDRMARWNQNRLPCARSCSPEGKGRPSPELGWDLKVRTVRRAREMEGL